MEIHAIIEPRTGFTPPVTDEDEFHRRAVELESRYFSQSPYISGNESRSTSGKSGYGNSLRNPDAPVDQPGGDSYATDDPAGKGGKGGGGGGNRGSNGTGSGGNHNAPSGGGSGGRDTSIIINGKRLQNIQLKPLKYPYFTEGGSLETAVGGTESWSQFERFLVDVVERDLPYRDDPVRALSTAPGYPNFKLGNPDYITTEVGMYVPVSDYTITFYEKRGDQYIPVSSGDERIRWIDEYGFTLRGILVDERTAGNQIGMILGRQVRWIPVYGVNGLFAEYGNEPKVATGEIVELVQGPVFEYNVTYGKYIDGSENKNQVVSYSMKLGHDWYMYYNNPSKGQDLNYNGYISTSFAAYRVAVTRGKTTATLLTSDGGYVPFVNLDGLYYKINISDFSYGPAS